MTKILITDLTHPVLEERLREAGFNVTVATGLDRDETIAAAQGKDALVVRSKVIVDRQFIDRCPSLRCIGRVGAGMETIDVAYAESRGIVCLNSPEGNRDAVGEHTASLLLALLCKTAAADAEVRQGLWQREANRGLELGPRTVGIIGFGNMGSAFAKKISGFGCKILAYDKYKYNYAPKYVEECSLKELQQKADIVSLHVPLTPETHHMVDAAFLGAFAKPIHLLNTSRGSVVDTAALVDAMERQRVLGAGLDVLEYEDMSRDGLAAQPEPEPLQYLRRSPRTVLTPHVAGWTVESRYKLADVLARKIIAVLCS
ncbi:MAG: hypothetical protein K5650_06170 [Bacteroidales bacterium]|nr:hypothetical protein [Bacteroidales bacterium]